MPTLSIADVSSRVPDFRVALVACRGDGLALDRSPAVEAYVAKAQADCRTRWAGAELSSIPGVAAWRQAYKGFGIKSTSYRSSVERLIKRVLAGDDIPRINAFVDLYNAVSVTHGLCLGADDADAIGPDLAFRFAREGDDFIDMAPLEGLQAQQPPKAGEVVYASGSRVLCRRWNWRQDARSIVTAASARIVLTIQSNGVGSVEDAAADFIETARAALGFDCRCVVADAARPVASFSV